MEPNIIIIELEWIGKKHKNKWILIAVIFSMEYGYSLRQKGIRIIRITTELFAC